MRLVSKKFINIKVISELPKKVKTLKYSTCFVCLEVQRKFGIGKFFWLSWLYGSFSNVFHDRMNFMLEHIVLKQ